LALSSMRPSLPVVHDFLALDPTAQERLHSLSP
jgi:hypothetical protein